MRTESIEHYVYNFKFIDYSSKFLSVHFGKFKNEAEAAMKIFIPWFERVSEKDIIQILSDGGGEFTAHAVRDYCQSLGITQQFTAAYSPQTNGLAERMNFIIMQRVRAMLRQSGLPTYLWSYAMKYTVLLYNVTVNSTGNSPYETLFLRKPSFY